MFSVIRAQEKMNSVTAGGVHLAAPRTPFPLLGDTWAFFPYRILAQNHGKYGKACLMYFGWRLLHSLSGVTYFF